MSFPSLSQFDLTTLNLCESIFDSSNDPTAIKFMQIAPEIFPQFMNRNNNNNHQTNSLNNHSIAHRIQSDTDTTNSNETVYSQDEIKAAKQLLNMHSFIQSNPIISHSTSNRNKRKKRKKHSRSKKQSIKQTVPISHKHKTKKFKKINNIIASNNINLNSFDSVISDLECVDNNFYLYSEYICNLDAAYRRGDIEYKSLINIYPYICNYNECFELFKSKSSLQSHSMCHKYLSCPICNKQFNKKNNANKNILFQHIKNNHQMYYCIKCKNIYKTVTQLTNHKCLFKHAIHKHNIKHKYKLKEKAFKCKVCKKGFVSKSNLQKHAIVHNGQRKFKCKFCNKGYIQKWRCKKHMEQCQ